MKAGTTGGRKRELADRIAHARVTAAELSEWRAKAEAAGISLSELLRAAVDTQIRVKPLACTNRCLASSG